MLRYTGKEEYTEKDGVITITRRVRVYARPPQRVLETLSCTQDTDKEVVSSIPSNVEGRVNVQLFQGASALNNAELEIQLSQRGLKSYPLAQIVFNKAYPEFAVRYFNITQFVDFHGNWCYVAFDGRSVRAHRCTGLYSQGLWFLGIS